MAVCFGVLTTIVLILGLSGLASKWVYGGITQIEFWQGKPNIQDSYWDSVLARTSWNYLLLFLIPFTIEGWRRFRSKTDDEIRQWFTSLMLAAPILVLVAMLTQISVGAYWYNASHHIWPIYLAIIACVYLILIKLGRWTKTKNLSMIVSAASFSLFTAGVWLLARGPGLYWIHGLFPDLRTVWVPVIRYMVSSCLILGGLVGIYSSRAKIDGLKLTIDHKTLLRRIPTPICFSGILLMAILAEYIIRLYLAYRVLLPPVTLFPQVMITASIVAMIGTLLASRQLADLLPIGPRFPTKISGVGNVGIHPT
jgi:hypothetical protein